MGVVAGSLTTNRTVSDGAGVLRWLGHSCFYLRSPAGVHVLIDPFNEELGYPVPDLPDIDLVLLSHEHADHANVGLSAGTPKVLCGATADVWHAVGVRQADVSARMIPGAYHDEVQGAARGRTAIISLELGDVRFVHLGDLGHMLDANLIAQTKGHDVVLAPVGGCFTVDGRQAAQVVDQIDARLALPMHYRPSDREIPLPLATLEESGFLTGRRVRWEHTAELTIAISCLLDEPEIVVLQPPGQASSLSTGDPLPVASGPFE